MNCTIELTNPDLFTLYRVGDWTHVVDYNPYRSYYRFDTSYYQDFFNNRKFKKEGTT